MVADLQKVRSIADYQFGKGVGKRLFPEDVQIGYSPRTGRIRYIHLGGVRLATLRPTDSMFSLSIAGAKRVVESAQTAKCMVNVKNEVAKFIIDGGDVFATHVVKVDGEVRAKDEVVVLDENNGVLAIGRAALCAEEMKAFKRGVAVKVRRGNAEEG